MLDRAVSLLTLLLFAAGAGRVCAEEAVVSIAVDPQVVRLVGPQATFTLLVEGKTAAGTTIDLTRAARYHVKDAATAQVTAIGIVRGTRDGITEIAVAAAGHRQVVRVEVTD